MTVKELIEFLLKCSPDSKVGFSDINFGGFLSELDIYDITIKGDKVLIRAPQQDYID